MKSVLRMTNRIGLFLLGMVVTMFAFVSCEQQVTPLEVDSETPNLSGLPFTIIVHEYETMRQMHYDLRRQNLDVQPNAIGYTVRGKNGDEHVCHIFVLSPRHVEDQRLSDWGHELYHCVAGRFHKEGHQSRARRE